ncbi:hypothetical protein ACWDWU_19020 [Streptomyces sp. NPDC003442]
MSGCGIVRPGSVLEALCDNLRSVEDLTDVHPMSTRLPTSSA